MAERLSDVFARKCLPPSRGLLIHWDTEVKGFGLRLTPGGSKSFVVDYRAEGRQRRMTIGAYPDWTVAAAREVSRTQRTELKIHNRDGRISQSDSHGGDPKPPPG